MTAPVASPTDATALALLRSIRALLVLLLVVSVATGIIGGFQLDYSKGNRSKITATSDRTQKAVERVEGEFQEFNIKNQAFLDNHARTQRIVCQAFRANGWELPDDGSCEDR